MKNVHNLKKGYEIKTIIVTLNVKYSVTHKHPLSSEVTERNPIFIPFPL